jgi:hypothetical protein
MAYMFSDKRTFIQYFGDEISKTSLTSGNISE